MFRRIVIGDHERVLVTRKRRFETILKPGVYWIFTAFRGISLERHNTLDLIFASEWMATLANQHRDLADRHFTVIETSESQVALVYLDGRLARVVAPASRVMYWRTAVAVTFTLIDVRSEPEVPKALLPALARMGRESLATLTAVDEGKRALVYLD